MIRTLTVHQPSAHMIVAGIKVVENRTWPTHHRGRVLIHAGNRYDHEIADWMERRGFHPPKPYESVHGAIIGHVEIVDCVADYCGLWSSFGAGGGPATWHWRLANAVMLDEPVEATGKQGWWEPAPDVLDRLILSAGVKGDAFDE